MSSTDTRALSRPTSQAARLGVAGLLSPFLLSASLQACSREALSLCLAGRPLAAGSKLRQVLLIVFGLAAALPSGVALAAGGASTVLWEKNVRLKIDSTETGPRPGVGVVLGAGMQGDRYSVIFSSVADLQRLVSESCEAR